MRQTKRFYYPNECIEAQLSAKKETIHQRKHLEKSLADSILSRAPLSFKKPWSLLRKAVPQAGCPPCPLRNTSDFSSQKSSP